MGFNFSLKNFQNHIYGQPVLTFAVRAVASAPCLNEHTRVKLQHNKEFIMFIFYLIMVLSMCNLLIKAFDTGVILSTPASDVH